MEKQRFILTEENLDEVKTLLEEKILSKTVSIDFIEGDIKSIDKEKYLENIEEDIEIIKTDPEMEDKGEFIVKEIFFKFIKNTNERVLNITAKDLDKKKLNMLVEIQTNGNFIVTIKDNNISFTQIPNILESNPLRYKDIWGFNRVSFFNFNTEE